MEFNSVSQEWAALVRYRVEHSKRNSICSRAHVVFYISSLVGHFRVHKSQFTSLCYEYQSSFILKLDLITITKISHLDSLWKRDRGEFGNGLLAFRLTKGHPASGTHSKSRMHACAMNSCMRNEWFIAVCWRVVINLSGNSLGNMVFFNKFAHALSMIVTTTFTIWLIEPFHLFNDFFF